MTLYCTNTYFLLLVRKTLINFAEIATISSEFQRIFDKATTSNTALVASINAQSDFWLENLKALQQAYYKLVTTNTNLVTLNTTLVATNNNLMEKINALEGVDKKLANAREQVKNGQNALNQAFGAHTVYKD